MNQDLNLLDLPVEMLEHLFSYCVGHLLKLTEANSFIKEVIETSPCLMENISLNLKADLTKNLSIEQQKILDACLKSNRKYKSIRFTDKADRNDFDFKTLGNTGTMLKSLFDQNSESITKVHLQFRNIGEQNSVDTLRFLENLLNVENITVYIFNPNPYGTYDDEDSLETNSDFQVASYNFNKLNYLSFGTEYSSAFRVFQECQSITTLCLEIHELETELTSFYSIMSNSREALESLNVKLFYEEDYIYVDEVNSKFAEFLIALKNSNLNLKFLNITFSEKLYHGNVVRFKEFLVSQKNLESLTFNGPVDQLLLNNMKDVPESLKILNFDIWVPHDNDEDATLYQPWTLKKIEILKLECESDLKDPNFVHTIFNSPSATLKEVSLTCLDLSSNALTTITRNHQNLTKLSVNGCENHESNDIFLILKTLKQLKTLKYDFPDESELNSDFFDNNGDLVLPEIKKIHLRFNNLIDNYHVIKLMQLLKNTSLFTFETSDWRNFDSYKLYLYTIIRELPNLKDFIDEKVYFGLEIDHSTLRRIKSIVQQFNKNPDIFSIGGKKIDVLIEKANKRQQ